VSTSNVSGTSPLPRRFIWAGMALGFGLGGFFDGILLHQVLQWHHLLSGVDDARLDIRTLILTDGLFHILMYIITCCGLWMLWRARRDVSWLVPDRAMVAFAAAGFGIWHVIDSVLAHWILGIHRVRMDVDNPLFWDLLWFALDPGRLLAEIFANLRNSYLEFASSHRVCYLPGRLGGALAPASV
jgi:uncharacterized membrane protein